MNDNIIKEEESEIYQYGTEQIIINLITLCAISIFAYILEVRLITLLWLVGFLPIRAVAGGYHADTPVKCNLLTVSVYLINIVVIQNGFQLMNYRMLVVILCSIILSIYKYAPPVDHKNKVLDYDEYLWAKSRSRLIGFALLIGCVSATIFYRLDNIYVFSTIIGAMTASISLVIGSVKRGGGERDEEYKVST